MPPTVYVLVTQVTMTSVMAALVTVPLPVLTAQVWYGVVGWVNTVTWYEPPLVTWVGNEKPPFAVRMRLSPALFCSTTVPARPVTVPPTA